MCDALAKLLASTAPYFMPLPMPDVRVGRSTAFVSGYDAAGNYQTETVELVDGFGTSRTWFRSAHATVRPDEARRLGLI